MIHLWIALGALLTVIVETAFLACFGFRSRRFILISILANLTSNYALNYFLLYLPSSWNYQLSLVLGELVVVLYESAIYLRFEKKKYELIPLTVAANILSFLLGLGYWALIP
jgi:hypothetical protein